MSTDQQIFADHRRFMFSVAYRILGSAADAEDVVQDAWFKWSSADQAAVADPKAYLARIVSNLSTDRLRSAQRRRETYMGPWLTEPIVTTPEIADDVELAESVSMALLVVLETLSPLERAVFVLNEVFQLQLRRNRRGRRPFPSRRTPSGAPREQPRRGTATTIRR
ncbi:sigma-70 family RNA polymerase sigma factor [Mycobacterium pseudokansasii]|uniref:sigma-70 family RNA polymerase sigma factor n=1 Tax=Mycobacterium pseudokansasii TaxID=2341080 RepID=UPI0023F2FC5B|nr:sigma-70 family RNA polymerase sigma factor [Mycobacterium pseudokansasii]